MVSSVERFENRVVSTFFFRCKLVSRGTLKDAAQQKMQSGVPDPVVCLTSWTVCNFIYNLALSQVKVSCSESGRILRMYSDSSQTFSPPCWSIERMQVQGASACALLWGTRWLRPRLYTFFSYTLLSMKKYVLKNGSRDEVEPFFARPWCLLPRCLHVKSAL